MSKRTYQQYCPLAHALDLVGERWTLLIVRELQLGPRRFSDLERGLPGLSPNLLSQRLDDLETWGLIAQEPLPPPARLQAYVLTPLGISLNNALAPLSQWGMHFLEMPIPEEEFLGAIPAMVALQLMFRPSLVKTETLTAEIHLDPDAFRLTTDGSGLRVEQGLLPGAPLVLHSQPKAFLGLATGQLPVEVALQVGALRIERGTPETAARLFGQFGLPDQSGA